MYSKFLNNIMEVIDETTENDDPYHDWQVEPSDKFIEELLADGYTKEEIYDVDLYGDKGILVDYRLLPREDIRYDKKENAMKLKMKYPQLQEYKDALIDLGVIYDSYYWDKPLKD